MSNDDIDVSQVRWDDEQGGNTFDEQNEAVPDAVQWDEPEQPYGVSDRLESMGSASVDAPESVAKWKDLSSRAGVSYDVAKAIPDQVEKKLKKPDWQTMVTSAPKTSQYLADNPRDFEIAKDDVTHLQELEAFKTELKKRGLPDLTQPQFQESPTAALNRELFSNSDVTNGTIENTANPDAALRFGDSPSEFIDNAGRVASTVTGALGTQFGASLDKISAAYDELTNRMDIVGFDDEAMRAAQSAENMRRIRAANAASEAATPTFDTNTARWLFGGVSSLVQTAPTLAVGAFNPLLGITMAGIQSGLGQSADVLERGGSTQDALIAGGAVGLIEGLTEKLPLGFVAENLGKMGVVDFAKKLLSRDMIGEQVATHTQDFVDAVYDPDKTMDQYLSERPEAAIQTVFGVGVNAAAMSGVQAVANRITKFDASKKETERDLADLDKQIDILQKTKTARLDRDVATNILNNMDDGDENDVYVDSALFHTGVVTKDVFLKAAPSAADQIDQAIETGGLIRVPRNELLVGVSQNADIRNDVMAHVKSDVFGDTQSELGARQSELDKELEEVANKAISMAKDKAKAADDLKDVVERFSKQFNETGYGTQQGNKKRAILWAVKAMVVAKQTGLSPMEAVDKYFGRLRNKGIGSPDNVFNQEKVADFTTLEKAKADVAAGIDPVQVQQETGWQKDDDGLWRFYEDAPEDVAPVASADISAPAQPESTTQEGGASVVGEPVEAQQQAPVVQQPKQKVAIGEAVPDDQVESVVKREAEKQNARLFQGGDDAVPYNTDAAPTELSDEAADDLVTLYQELGSDDDNFQYARKTGDDLDADIISALPEGTVQTADEAVIMAAQMDAEDAGAPDIVDVKKYSIPTKELLVDANDKPILKDGKKQYATQKRDAYVYINDAGEYWTDLSDLKRAGGVGGIIYTKVADFAEKNGGVFRGDPLGLSDDALLKRTEHMASGIARRKDTGRFIPHERQLTLVDKDHATSPLNTRARAMKWVKGNDTINRREIVKTAFHNITQVMPELRHAWIDPDTGRILVRGTPLNTEFDAWVHELQTLDNAQDGQRGEGQSGSVAKQREPLAAYRHLYASASIKRQLLANTLARYVGESAERRRQILDRLGEISKDLESYDGRKLFYQSKKAESAKEAPNKKLIAERDAEYMAAVERGDMEAAQRLVDEAAAEAGYNPSTSERMNHAAPNSTDGFSVSLDKIRESGMVPDDYWTHPQYYTNDSRERSAHYDVRDLFRRLDRKKSGEKVTTKITVYRSIPKNTKDTKLRNGDWVSTNRSYAVDEGLSIPGGYRIVSEKVEAASLYWDGNSIAELGFDNGKGYAYKNTKNNRKLLDAIVRDYDGNIVPLSKRFNSRKTEEFYQNDTSPRGFFDPSTRDITMLAKADLSTFLHETGHLFLEIQAELALDENASERMKSDMDTVLKWFGVKGENASERLAAWNAMTLEEKRKFHEKYAESFEQYLFEGKAPSAELNEVFQTFRAWLSHVYTSIKNFLSESGQNADLNDEIRSVFDRMLATEEQIAQAQQTAGMMPMYASRPEGVSDAEWEAYQQAADDYVQAATEQLSGRVLRDLKWVKNAVGTKGKIMREMRREAAALRREARMEARTRFLSRPIVQAYQFLTAPVEGVKARNKRARNSEHVDTARDSLFTAIAKLGGLNKEEAVSQYGIDPKDFLRKGGVFGKPVLRKEGGLSPDAMAEALSQFNYLPLDEHGKWDILDLEDLLREEAAGNPQYSTDVDMDVLLGEPQRAFFDAENVEYMGGRLNRIDIRNMFDDVQLAEMAGIDPYTGEAVATEPQQEGDDDALRKEFTDTEKAYGGEAAYEKAKADGKTKLNYRQWVQVRTPRFKEWFGDWENDPANASKGIDQDTGEPLVVYHGTDATRTVFDRKHLGRSSGRGTGTDWGFFFAKDRDHAEYWANNAGGDRVVESVYLRIENPLVIEDSGNDGGATLDRILDERLQDSDHDGAIIHGMQDDDSGELRTAYLVFDSEQIKSAIGNSGAFDGSNPNILRQNKKNKDTDLFVAHNLSEENLIHADELGGLAAPSLGVSRTTTGGFNGFGGITLLADKEILTDRYARTFDADVYSPRHPRAQENISYGNYIDLVQRIKENQGEVQGLEFRVDHDSLMRNGANDLANSEAFQNYYLVSKGIIIKPKKAKAAPAILNAIKYLKKNAKHDSAYEAYNLRDEDWFKSLAEEHYKAEFEKWKNLRDDFTPAELVKYGPFEEDGSLKYHLYNELALLVENYHKKGGQDSAATRGAIAKHFRTDKGSAELQEFARAELEKISSGKQLVKYTKNGNQKRSAYTLENIVAEMTRELLGGEGFNYGAGSVRSAFAFEFKHNTIESIKSFKKNIVSKQEMDKVRDDANNKLSEALDRLAKFYKYDSTSWGYTNDASSAIAEGPKGWSSAFKMTTESKKIITDLVTYLRNLPSEYFETKMQRAVGIGEFKTAVVPKGISAKAMAILEKNGLNVVTYDPKKEGSRTAVIAKQEDILFQKKGKDSKPKNRTLESMGVLSDDGILPELVAGYFGMETEQLIRGLLGAPELGDIKQAIENMTDQIMLERHADLATPEAMAEATLKAVMNKARAKFVATEYAILAKAAGGARATEKQAKEYAQRVIGETKVKDVKPEKFIAAAAKAGKEAQKAMAKSDTKAALLAKRNQVLNEATAKLAVDVKDEVKKFDDLAAKIIKATNEKNAKRGRDPDVVNAITAVMGFYGFYPSRQQNAMEYLERVREHDPDMFLRLQDAVNRAAVNQKDFNDLTINEMRGLREEIEGLWYTAKRSRQMEIDGKKIDLQEAADGLVTRLLEVGLPDEKLGAKNAPTEKDLLTHKLKTAGAWLTRVEQWAERMDGQWGGAFTRYIFQPVKKAADRYRTEATEYNRRYVALIDALPKMKRGLIAAPELGYTFGAGDQKVGMAELLHAVLHTGNASNKRKLLLGRGWAVLREDGTLDTARWDVFVERMHKQGVLKKEHYDFAQGVWDLLEDTKAGAQKTHRDVFGYYFAEVTADAFGTPFGIYRGGYVPAQADPRLVVDAAQRAMAEEENNTLVNAFPATAKGFTKGRTEYNKPLMLDLQSLSQHINKVLLFTHMEPAVRDVKKLLMRNDVAETLGAVDRAAYDSMLTPWLSVAARQSVNTPVTGDAGISNAVNIVRNNTGMALMAANLSNAMQQITGFLTATQKVKGKYILRETASFLARPKEYANEVRAASEYMAVRMDAEIHAINSQLNELLIAPTAYQKTKAFAARHAYFLQAMMDNTISPIIWRATFNQSVEKGMTDADAEQYANATIRQTQGSSLPEDVSRIEVGGAFWRATMQFYGYFNSMVNTNVVAVKNAKTKSEAMGHIIYGAILPAIVAQSIAVAMRGGVDDDDYDGWLDDWITEVAGTGLFRYATAMVPVVGAFANLAVGYTTKTPVDDRMQTSATTSMIGSALRAVDSVPDAITGDGKPSKAIKDVAAGVSLFTGLPIFALARPVGYAADVAAGEVSPTSVADTVRGMLTGTASPGSK